jgi:hypothetical protein
MGKVYERQTSFYIEATITDCDGVALDLTGCTCTAAYKKPDGVGTWPVTVVNAAAGIVRWQPSSTADLGVPGAYSIWFSVTSEGREIPSEPYRFLVYARGE